MPAETQQLRGEPDRAIADELLADLVANGSGDSPLAARTAIVVAHPDDEVVSLGSRLQRLRRAILIHVTDGAPRNGVDATAYGFATISDYAVARRQELKCAVALAGISQDHLRQLNCPDQEASLRLVELASELATQFQSLRAQRIITHPYEGGHPDHDATAFIVHAARRLLENAGHHAPQIVEASSYHMGPTGIEVACFLRSHHGEVTVHLTQTERDVKRRMIDCFESQQQTLSYFPFDVECYRVAELYDFTRPPHPGTLFYDKFDWGMRGERFIELAAQAQRALQIEGPM